MSDTGHEVAQVRRKLLRRFYEPLLLLNALGQIRGKRIKPDLEAYTLGASHQKLRRSFVDGIAYISSYEKGPDHVTAAALERSANGVVVWLAANGTIHPRVIEFLKEILADIHTISNQATANERHVQGHEMQEELLTRVIAFNEPRLRAYYNLVHSYSLRCLPAIKQEINSTSKLDDT